MSRLSTPVARACLHHLPCRLTRTVLLGSSVDTGNDVSQLGKSTKEAEEAGLAILVAREEAVMVVPGVGVTQGLGANPWGMSLGAWVGEGRAGWALQGWSAGHPASGRPASPSASPQRSSRLRTSGVQETAPVMRWEKRVKATGGLSSGWTLGTFLRRPDWSSRLLCAASGCREGPWGAQAGEGSRRSSPLVWPWHSAASSQPYDLAVSTQLQAGSQRDDLEGVGAGQWCWISDSHRTASPGPGG